MTSAKSSLEEYVMVISTEVLFKANYFQGISFDTRKFIELIENPKVTRFKKRKDVEKDPNYKQIIPYALLRHEKSIFSYRRGKLLKERRLLGNYSIGIGGHISLYDENLFTETYNEGMDREINEEIEIGTEYDKSLVAVLNDDKNEVGRVHFGVIYIFNLTQPSISPKEKSINEGKFISISELTKNIDKYENWSQICIEHIEDIIKIQSIITQ